MSINSPTGNLFLDIIIAAGICIGVSTLLGGIAVFIYFIFEEVSDRRRYKKAAQGTKANPDQEHVGQEEQLSSEFAQVGSAVTFLKEEALKETARQEALQGKEFTVEKITALLYAVSGELQELRQWVQQLTIERDALAKGNARLVTKLSIQQERRAREDYALDP
ncbi:MAG: hypothetical protein RSC08_02540 [Oscillospiraceae bacterium]